ncbi:hypothetical protein AB0G64_05135 [Streptomyces longwoodensis]|uniref:hypothetical protein n=1 Tax=Streptomyces longwoodensis TaxID=68231 RepID=UPI0033EEECE6
MSAPKCAAQAYLVKPMSALPAWMRAPPTHGPKMAPSGPCRRPSERGGAVLVVVVGADRRVDHGLAGEEQQSGAEHHRVQDTPTPRRTGTSATAPATGTPPSPSRSTSTCSTPVSVNLDRALVADQQVEDLNYGLAWDQPHAGNLPADEAEAAALTGILNRCSDVPVTVNLPGEALPRRSLVRAAPGHERLGQVMAYPAWRRCASLFWGRR